METTDLKLIWERHHQEIYDKPKYSIEEIHNYRKAKPTKLAKSVRMNLIFDIVYKLILCTGWLSLMFWIKQPWAPIVSLIFVAILLMLLGVERQFLKQWNRIDLTTTIQDSLRTQHAFMRKAYSKFLLISALSNSFFVSLGFVIYGYHKYQEAFEISQLAEPVLIGFIILAFFISALAQWPAYENDVADLEINLKAIEDDELQGIQISKEKSARIRNLVIFGFLALVGLTILGLIIIQLV